MPYNWQAYLDRSLTASEMSRHENALRTDPLAAKQLGSLKALRTAIHDSALSESVPMAKLSTMLKSTSRPPLTLKQGLATAGILTVGLAAAMVVTQNRNQPTACPNIRLSAQVHNAKEAQSWLSQNSSEPAPLLSTLSEKALICHVEAGPHVQVWNVSYLGAEFQITRSHDTPVGSLEKVLYESKEYLVGPLCVCWKNDKSITFEVDGSGRQGRLAVAALIRKDDKGL